MTFEYVVYCDNKKIIYGKVKYDETGIDIKIPRIVAKLIDL